MAEPGTELAKTDQLGFVSPVADGHVDVERLRYAIRNVAIMQVSLELGERRPSMFQGWNHREENFQSAVRVDLEFAVDRRNDDAMAIARAPMIFASRLLDRVEELQRQVDELRASKAVSDG